MNKEKDLKALFRDWYYKVQGSRFNRFCKHCNHREQAFGSDTYCGWFGEECVEACRFSCPIPTAMVSMLLKCSDDSDIENQGTIQVEKGGTVVPPSDFQSVSTQETETQKDTKKSPRPHGSACARLREDTPNGHPKNDPKIEDFW